MSSAQMKNKVKANISVTKTPKKFSFLTLQEARETDFHKMVRKSPMCTSLCYTKNTSDLTSTCKFILKLQKFLPIKILKKPATGMMLKKSILVNMSCL